MAVLLDDTEMLFLLFFVSLQRTEKRYKGYKDVKLDLGSWPASYPHFGYPHTCCLSVFRQIYLPWIFFSLPPFWRWVVCLMDKLIQQTSISILKVPPCTTKSLIENLLNAALNKCVQKCILLTFQSKRKVRTPSLA